MTKRIDTRINIHQRVQLAGSNLIGTTVSVSEMKVLGRPAEREFQVRWDNGRTGTVKESDLEPFETRVYKSHREFI